MTEEPPSTDQLLSVIRVMIDAYYDNGCKLTPAQLDGLVQSAEMLDERMSAGETSPRAWWYRARREVVDVSLPPMAEDAQGPPAAPSAAGGP